MVHAHGTGLQMAVEHGAVGLDAQAVGLAGDAQPLGGTGLVGADTGAQVFVEDLGAAAGHHDQTGVLEALQHFEGGTAFHPGEVGDLHRGEGLDEQAGIEFARGTQGVQEPLERTGGMAAAHDVQLVQMQGRGISGAQALQHFFGTQAESPLVFFAVAAEGAENAAVDADIGIIYLAVDHIRGLVPVHAATRMVGQGAHGGDVGAGEKRHAVFGAQALAGKDLVQNVGKPEACVIGSIQHNGYPQMMIGRRPEQRNICSSLATCQTVVPDQTKRGVPWRRT